MGLQREHRVVAWRQSPDGMSTTLSVATIFSFHVSKSAGRAHLLELTAFEEWIELEQVEHINTGDGSRSEGCLCLLGPNDGPRHHVDVRQVLW